MIYTHFIGHVGREGAKVITGTHGQFMSFDMAVQNFDKGEFVHFVNFRDDIFVYFQK